MINYPIMIRTFHAVGHGCFVTERFKSQKGNNEINVVYDCGGLKKSIDKEINNTFKPNDEIYALCISHFHNDHINGLPTLLNRCRSINNLWIPFLTKKEKIILTFKYISDLNLTSNIEQINIGLELINNPDNLFNGKDTIIHRILPRNYEEFYEEYRDLRNKNDIESSINLLNNHTEILFDWQYVPYYRVDFVKINELYKYLISNSSINKYLNNSELNTSLLLNDLKDKTLRSKLIREFKRFFDKYGGSNENSLILFSGINNIDKLNCLLRFNTKLSEYNYLYHINFYDECNLSNLQSGCLYFGDYDCNEDFYEDKRFLDNYLKESGIIMLPHHGSLNSFSNDLLNDDYKYKIAVACHGKNDQYGHPSSWVCDQLYLNNKTVINVTEETSTSASFIIYHEY